MGDLGDLLECLYEAPRIQGGVHLQARERVDQTAVRRFHEWAREQLDREQGGRSTAIMIAGSGEAPEGWRESIHELWRVGPEVWRADSDDRVTVQIDDELLTYSPGIGGVRSPASPGSMHQWSVLVESRWIIDRFDIEIGEAATVADRSCWTLELRPSATSMPWHRMPMLMMVQPWSGQDHRCRIDRETGIVLQVDSRFEGEICSSWTTTVFELPDAIDPTVVAFVPPDGSGFRTHLELRVEMLRRSGVDVSGIDPTDEAQVNAAAMARHHGVLRRDPAAMAEQHVPNGPLPEDAEAAEVDVRDAFERIVNLSEDGESVPAVEGGANLGPCLREAAERAPGGPDLPTTGRVEHVKFLNRGEAVVWFTLLRGGDPVLGTMEGRARLVGDRWLVGRATFCQIVGSVGVRCPPPPTER